MDVESVDASCVTDSMTGDLKPDPAQLAQRVIVKQVCSPGVHSLVYCTYVTHCPVYINVRLYVVCLGCDAVRAECAVAGLANNAHCLCCTSTSFKPVVPGKCIRREPLLRFLFRLVCA